MKRAPICSVLFLLLGCVHAQTIGKPGYASKVVFGGNLEIALYSPTMFRLRVSKLSGEKFPAKYEIPFLIGHLQNWPEVKLSQGSTADSDWVQTSDLRIVVSRRDQSWRVWSADGKKQIYPSSGPQYGMFRDGYAVFDSAAPLDQRSDYRRSAHWFYSESTGRYVDTFLAEDLIMDYYFIYGPGYDRLFEQLNALVGPEPLLPKKAYGFAQTQHLGCKGTQTQLMEVAKRLRADHIPTDTLLVDFEWGDGCPGGDEDDKYWGQLDWAPAYKTPQSPRDMVSALRDMHFDVMLIHHSAPDFPHRAESIRIDPKREWTSRVYEEPVWWGHMREQLGIGVRGTWQDTRKNDVTDSVIWKGLQDYYGTSQRVMFLGNRNMVEVDPWELKRDDRVPSNSLLGSRRYPFRWTGDAHTTWSELQYHIDAITNTFGPMQGVTYITADGFGDNWKQQARWNQFLAFSAVARSHTMKPWEVTKNVQSLGGIMAFGEKRDRTPAGPGMTPQAPAGPVVGLAESTAEDSIRKNLALRYRLLPYIYSTAHENYSTGMPIARPMVLAFPDDLHCAFNRERYQYMLGPSLLVAPVWADLNSMDVYLPEGSNWIDYATKAAYSGGQTITVDTSDVTRIPLFVRSGSILPMRRDTEWLTPGEADDPLTLDVYSSTTRSTFSLYDDDGATTRYQSGEFATTLFEAVTDTSGDTTLRLGPSQGKYNGMPAARVIIIRLELREKVPQSVFRNGAPLPLVTSPTMWESAADGWRYDPAENVVLIKLPKKSADKEVIRVSNSR